MTWLCPRDALTEITAFSPPESRSGSGRICQSNMWEEKGTFLIKERRCTPAEIKGAGSLATPTNLGPGMVAVGNLWPRFLQHTTSLTDSSAEAPASVVRPPHGGQEPPPASAAVSVSSTGC